jgi:hypothetical protein
MEIEKSVECEISKKDMKLYDEFINFLKKEYPLEHNIKIRFMSSRLDEMTTGARTNKHTLKILVKGRMNRDVLRTLAHEWIHEYQRTVLGRKKQKNVGSKNENEANAKAGEVIKKFEDKHPKLTNQMYESIIKKIIREEVEGYSDFDWIHEIPSFLPGKYFDEDSVCFNNQGDDCEINIGDDETVFSLDYEKWRDRMSEGFGDNESIIEPLLENPNYSNDNDYYDLDYEEFDYAGYHMSSEQKERLEKIVKLISPNIDLEEYLNDNLNDLEKHLLISQIKRYWDTLQNRFIEILSYKIQENRWNSIAEYYRTLTLGSDNKFKFPVKFKKSYSRWYDTIEITLSTKDLITILEKNTVNNDLSKALNELSSIVTNVSWYDYFYEEWDTSGAEWEIRDAFDKFLSNSEEYIDENPEEFMEQKKFYDRLQKLGFKPTAGYGNVWSKNDDVDGWIWVADEIDLESNKLRLRKTKRMSGGTDPKNVFQINFDDLPFYLSQYRMDI